MFRSFFSIVSVVALFSTAGCVESYEDRWDGDCIINLAGEEIVLDIEIDIEEQDGVEVEGTGELYVDGFGRFEGDVTGEVDGDTIEWELEIDDNGYEATVTFEATRVEPERIEGDCELKERIDGGGTFDGDLDLGA